MATGTRRGGDIVLGGRHITGIFLVLVVLFGLVFTLGYVLGRSHYDTQLGAVASTVPSGADNATESPTASSQTPAEDQPKAPAPDWEFYHSAEPSKPPQRLAVRPKAVSTPNAAATPTPAPAKPSSRRAPGEAGPTDSGRSMDAPLMPRGATVLQVAALVREGDALALAQALQQKKFPAFILNPSADRYYRVQVGPYADAQSANTARRRLESQGFKSIVKR